MCSQVLLTESMAGVSRKKATLTLYFRGCLVLHTHKGGIKASLQYVHRNIVYPLQVISRSTISQQSNRYGHLKITVLNFI